MPLASLLCEIPASSRAALIPAATFRSTWVAAFRRSRGASAPKGLSVALCVAAGDIPKGAFGRKFEPLGLDPAPSRASVRKQAPANFQKGDDQVHSSPRFSLCSNIRTFFQHLAVAVPCWEVPAAEVY